MKALVLSLFATAVLLTACATNSPTKSAPKTVAEYRAQYGQVFAKWEKETDSAKRAQLEQQMDDLKAKNLHLFVK